MHRKKRTPWFLDTKKVTKESLLNFFLPKPAKFAKKNAKIKLNVSENLSQKNSSKSSAYLKICCQNSLKLYNKSANVKFCSKKKLKPAYC